LDLTGAGYDPVQLIQSDRECDKSTAAIERSLAWLKGPLVPTNGQPGDVGADK
jgi:hypothetical protein